VGTEVAGYRIVAPLGRGGMGVVYLAEEVGLGRPVALKLLPPALAGDAAFRRRFLREMRVAAAIDHPNIVPIYRAGEEGGQLFIAMRYVDASDLRRVLELQRRLEPGRALAILEQVARALDAAHAAGLVHRDVKPANILLTAPLAGGEAEHVYLVDFGLARSAEPDASITGGGLFVGTPRYAAPEQVAGGPVDGRTDGYALGCVLFECLAGRPPFPAATDLAVLLAHLQAPPPRLTAERPDLPAALDQVIARALAKAREDRFGSCRELVAAARRALATRPAGPTPAPAPPPATPAVGTRTVALRPPLAVGSPASGRWPGHVPARAPATPPAWRPLGRVARWLRRALRVAVLIALVGAAVNAGDTVAARRLLGTGAGTGGLYLRVGAVQALWFVVTAWLFLVWFRAAYANLPALGARGQRFRRWWAVGGWLVPIFSLFRPLQLLGDIWRASDPDDPPDQGVAWRGRPVPALLGWWWLVFVASVLVRSITTEAVHAVASFLLLGLVPAQLDRYRNSAGMDALADLLTVLAGVLALAVVRRISARQEARAARLAGQAGRQSEATAGSGSSGYRA
jgi:serine/threonine-protein kinase